MQNSWIEQIFDSQQAQQGGMVRRSVSSIRRFASINELIYAVRLRGFHMVRNGAQYVIFCNTRGLEIVL